VHVHYVQSNSAISSYYGPSTIHYAQCALHIILTKMCEVCEETTKDCCCLSKHTIWI